MKRGVREEMGVERVRVVVVVMVIVVGKIWVCRNGRLVMVEGCSFVICVDVVPRYSIRDCAYSVQVDAPN